MASHKLRHYFLVHDITVPTAYPLGDMFCKKEAIGRIGKWAVEVAPFALSGQIDKSFQARHPELTKYLIAFRKAEAHFKGISVRSIPRSKIADVDALAKVAANNEPLPAHVLYEVLHGSAAQDTDPDATLAPVTAITTTPD
ncbi:hypothetical protein E2562_021465 [Oryza meyeriana var. granulata]|uniref:Uncharacterized protein n=1 Tax=Oryza meyeriana var. granulata TaxID=110450 RepID=A0A6G1DZ41_9ORYZ|nr:hypothetical protein E2562_021465 [Oryza meyeriana var. granulata]